AYDTTWAWLRDAGDEMGWRPSRNPYARQADGVVQFVTLRAYTGTRADVDARVERALERLESRGIRPVEVKRETTVFDTRRDHDAWWA
ncbi:MAG: hypothetical protein AAF211_19310, partial [Myxococcota bacterium]